MRDFSRRTEKIAICRGEWEISRSVAENVKNRDLSRRIGNFAVSYMPRNPFVPGSRVGDLLEPTHLCLVEVVVFCTFLHNVLPLGVETSNAEWV